MCDIDIFFSWEMGCRRVYVGKVVGLSLKVVFMDVVGREGRGGEWGGGFFLVKRNRVCYFFFGEFFFLVLVVEV